MDGKSPRRNMQLFGDLVILTYTKKFQIGMGFPRVPTDTVEFRGEAHGWGLAKDKQNPGKQGCCPGRGTQPHGGKGS